MAVNEGEPDGVTAVQPPPQPEDASVPLDGWDPTVNQDDLIKAQEEKIGKDIADRIPLVSEPETLDNLSNEYACDDRIYRIKIEDLKSNYQYLRRTRPDGNCFFRAFGYSYFETLLKDQAELTRFRKVVEERRDDMFALGFPKFTIEDFHEQFDGILDRIGKDVQIEEDLLKIFNENGISDYLVVYLRLITSCYLQKNEEFFSAFIEGFSSIKDFCGHEVEPMFKESDHIHIIALTQAIEVSVRINHLDRGGDEKVSLHTFPEGTQPRIHLLYRPGHYDILYPRPNNSFSTPTTAAAAVADVEPPNSPLASGHHQSTEVTSSNATS